MGETRAAADMLAEVALPLPLFNTFSYRLDNGLANAVVPGARVVVPFRNRKEIGICVGFAEPNQCHPVLQVDHRGARRRAGDRRADARAVSVDGVVLRRAARRRVALRAAVASDRRRRSEPGSEDAAYRRDHERPLVAHASRPDLRTVEAAAGAVRAAGVVRRPLAGRAPGGTAQRLALGAQGTRRAEPRAGG